MNPTAVVQAANEFPWGLVLLVVVIAGLAYVWRSGMLGKPTEDVIKAKIRDLRGKAAAEEAKLIAINAPIATAPAKDKPTRIAEAKALLDAGTITQPQYDAAVAKIVAE